MFKKIITRKNIVAFLLCAALVGSVVAVGAYNLSKPEKRAAYEKSKKDFAAKKDALDAVGEPKNSAEAAEKTKQAVELKKKALELEALGQEVKTQEEFAEELEDALSTVKLALNDVKVLGDAKTNKDTRVFIRKMEKKIARIEKEFSEGTKSPEQLLIELRDRSDVDN